MVEGGETMGAQQWPEDASGLSGAFEPGALGEPARAPYLWAIFSTDAGIDSPDSKVLRRFFTRKGYGTKNALVVADTRFAGKQSDSSHAAALFRVRNVTDETVAWPVSVFMTGSASLGEPRSIAVNQEPVASDAGDYGMADCAKHVTLRMPADQASTVVFMAGAGPDYDVSSSLGISARSLCLGFFNNCLDLPAGLEFVDDLLVTVEGVYRD